MDEEDKTKNGFGQPLVAVVLLALGLVVGFFVGSTRNKTGGEAQKMAGSGEPMQLQLVNHIQAGLPEQDVFVTGADGESGVRVDVTEGKEATAGAQEVFSAAVPVEHDPFKLGENPLGPFPKGASLGMTLGEWLAAAGTGSYQVSDSKATLSLNMTKLVPSGVYTVWCSRIKLPPEPLVVDTPCGAIDGAENVFSAGRDGSANFNLTMTPLPESTQSTVNVVAVAYHSDGKTYGPNPGPFGQKTHVQLFYLMPAPEAQ
ncbi:MAG: hypothetical protein HYS86_01220 [Candidatus Chisholmbacteria bacterium]|nr:hypothetical protein [Candidatus Chisholmbacteria bacterium]